MPDIVFTISIKYLLNQSFYQIRMTFQVNEYRSVILSNSGSFLLSFNRWLYVFELGKFTTNNDRRTLGKLHPAREQDTSTSFLFYMNESDMPRQKFTRLEVLYASNLCSIDLVHRIMLMGHTPNNG
jgi:hypothetical protein